MKINRAMEVQHVGRARAAQAQRFRVALLLLRKDKKVREVADFDED
jgi:hypothetical protein